MLSQKLLLPIVASAAVGGYVLTQSNPGGADPSPAEIGQDQLAHQVEAALAAANTFDQEPVFLPINGLGQVIRFDVTPFWIQQNWQHISQIQTEPGLEALRVSMVTGTGQTDVMGSLTYYFDSNQRVERIQLVGTTGDPAALLDFGKQNFRLKNVGNQRPQVLVARSMNKPTCFLSLNANSANQSTSRTTFHFEVLAPGSKYLLSPGALLEIERHSKPGSF